MMVFKMLRKNWKMKVDFQFQLWQINSLDVFTLILTTRKSWANWKTVTFLSSVSKLRSQGKPHLNLEKWAGREKHGQISVLGTEAAGARNWQEHWRKFCWTLETEWGVGEFEIPGDPVSGRGNGCLPLLSWGLPPKLLPDSHCDSKKKSPSCFCPYGNLL